MNFIFIAILIFTDPVTKTVHGPSCIVARNTTSNNIVGIRTGQIYSRKEKKKDPSLSWLSGLPKWLRIPPLVIYLANADILMAELHYDKYKIWDELGDASMIYFCYILCVGGDERGKGLGAELIKRGYDIAKKVSQIFIKLQQPYNFQPIIF